MSEMDQAEQEVIQNATYMADKLFSLADLSLSVMDGNVQKIIENLREKETETYGKMAFYSREVAELKDRISTIEAHNQLNEREQERIEADLQSCRPWEFSKKNDLKSQLKEACAKPKEDAESLKQQLREKEELCRKNRTEYKNLKERRENLENDMLHSKNESRENRHNVQKTRRTVKNNTRLGR